MKGFLKFFALVLLLVPAWIGFLTITGEDRAKHRPSTGPLVALSQALQGEGDGLWVSDMVAMVPVDPANAWHIEGLAARPEGASGAAARPFAAAMHAHCLPHWEATCWTVDRLDFPAAGNAAAQSDTAETAETAAAEGGDQADRLSLVQDQLRELGFDPGASDGVMGWQTRQAVAAYAAQTGNGADLPAAQALVELEATGRLSRAARRHAEGDYHGAVADYAKVLALDPGNVRAHFARGLIFRDLGLPGLAVSNFDAAIALRDDHVMAYHSRGNARFDRGDYWNAFADHADGLGVRYLGARYLAVRADLGQLRTQLAPGFAALVDWAEGAWDQARSRLAEETQRSNAGSGEKST